MKLISPFKAKNKLTEVVVFAGRGEPQITVKSGRKSAVIIDQ